MAVKFRMLLLDISKANDKVRDDGLIFMLCQIELGWSNIKCDFRTPLVFYTQQYLK